MVVGVELSVLAVEGLSEVGIGVEDSVLWVETCSVAEAGRGADDASEAAGIGLSPKPLSLFPRLTSTPSSGMGGSGGS